MSTKAPERFAAWLAAHEHKDPRYGFVYRYHPRSDKHSVKLCELIVEDLAETCPSLVRRAMTGDIVYSINCYYDFPASGKGKTLDLVIAEGTADPDRPALAGVIRPAKATLGKRGRKKVRLPEINRVLVSCECKAAMTEHSKALSRLFDELSSSHGIVHGGEPAAIAAGLSVVNIARTFVSPLRQTRKKKLAVTSHKQPEAAARVVEHLRSLPIRSGGTGTGFDAFATVVVDCDNQQLATLHTDPPAPQPGDADHYDTFLAALARACEKRLSE